MKNRGRALVAAVMLGVVAAGAVGISTLATCTNCTWDGHTYYYEYSYADNRCYTQYGVDHCSTYYDPLYVTCRYRDKYKVLQCDEGVCWQWVSYTVTCMY